jgi:hypothetical protein
LLEYQSEYCSCQSIIVTPSSSLVCHPSNCYEHNPGYQLTNRTEGVAMYSVQRDSTVTVNCKETRSSASRAAEEEPATSSPSPCRLPSRCSPARRRTPTATRPCYSSLSPCSPSSSSSRSRWPRSSSSHCGVPRRRGAWRGLRGVLWRVQRLGACPPPPTLHAPIPRALHRHMAPRPRQLFNLSVSSRRRSHRPPCRGTGT